MIDSYKLPAYISSQNSTENSQFYHELDLKDYKSDNGIDIKQRTKAYLRSLQTAYRIPNSTNTTVNKHL